MNHPTVTVTKVFTITENGFSVDGSGKVAVPACEITATSFMEAAEIMSEFMRTRMKPDCMELITPLEKIAFD
jgi:hypothetical protein